MSRLPTQTTTVVVLAVIVIIMVIVFSQETKPRVRSVESFESQRLEGTSFYVTAKKEVKDWWPIIMAIITWVAPSPLGRKK